MSRSGFKPKKEESPTAEEESLDPRSKLGVYALRKVAPTSATNKELMEMKEICLHNSQVCSDVGEDEKCRVWQLIAQLVETFLNEKVSSFDGRGGFGGAVFGMALVENFLRYYESLGDVQMLSTIVCVLRDKRHQQPEGLSFKLVPPGQDEKYDMYIRRYSDLLYGWGQLTTRAEVLKHLVNPTPNADMTPWLPGQPEEEEGMAGGIGLLFSCPRCAGETEPGTNVCRSVCIGKRMVSNAMLWL